ncbi:MAG: cadherin domain-containing protein [Beijerinckiaceae bacterium]|nr:cadherin domain-containing protein [Beijerinckiaceae bacterium]
MPGPDQQIDRPAAGEVRIVDVIDARTLRFAFSLADVSVSILDVDAVLTFPDGGRIIMPSFALQMVSDRPPLIQFNNAAVDPQSLLANAGDIRFFEQIPQMAVADPRRAPAGGDGNQSGTPQAVQLPSAQQFASTPLPLQRAVLSDPSGDPSVARPASEFGKRVVTAPTEELRSEGALVERSDRAGKAPEPENPTPQITSDNGVDSLTVGSLENATFIRQIAASDPNGENVFFAVAGGADASRFVIDGVTGKLYFLNPPDFESANSAAGNNIYEVQVVASDGQGQDRQQIYVAVGDANEAPISAVITASTLSENTALNTLVGTVTGTDLDGGTTLTYSFAPGGDAGGRFAIDAITGQLTVIRGDLVDFEASPQQLVVVRVTDQGGLFFDQPFLLTVQNGNDAPVIVSHGGGDNGALVVPENANSVLSVTAIDQDVADTITYSIIGGPDAARFTINAVTGTLTFVNNPDFELPADAGSDNVYNIIVQATDQAGGIDIQNLAITVTGVNEAPYFIGITGFTLPENAAIGAVIGTIQAADQDAGDTITYSFAPGGNPNGIFAIDASTGALSIADNSTINFNVTPSYSVVVRVTDSFGLSTDQIFTITVVDINQAPEITSNGGGIAATFNHVEGATFATTVTATDPDVGNVVTYSISGGADAALFTIDAATGALSFIVAPDFAAPTDANLDGTYEVIVQASDGLLADTQLLTINVIDNNTAPVITSNGGGDTAVITVPENSTSVFTTVTATDPDAGAVFTYSIVGGTDAARFTINATTGALRFSSGRNFEAPSDFGSDNVYDVIVQVSDGQGAVDTQAIAVVVTNVNENPTINSNGGGGTANIALAEGTSLVTTVTANDPDAGAVKIYSLFGGADASKFSIDATTGQLTFIAPPNFEAPTDTGADNVYTVVVRVQDGLGGSDTQTINVTVTDSNEAPTITSVSTVSITENGSSVLAVTATDPDAGAVLTYSIVGGADAGKFAIDSATGVLTFVTPPDFDVPGDAGGNNVYDVQVQVSDGLGGTATQNIAVTITNQNEAPGITSAATVSVAEGGTAVMTVTASDPDAGAALIYSIVGGSDAVKFAINPSTGVLTFVSSPDFEAPTDVGGDNVYDVRVQVSDGLGGTTTQDIAVTVTNQNEAPAITSSNVATITENSTAILTVLAADPDAGASLSYSIVGGADAAKFAINPTTGVLTFVAAPDFEAPIDAGGNNVYDVQVQVSDGLGGTFTQNIAITITNQNEAPGITSAAAVSVAENGTAVMTVTATDPDAGASLTYSITGGADAAKFVINPTTGVLTFVTAPDLESPTDAGGNNVYDVQVQVSDGLGGTATQNIAVTVTNQNDAPTITSSNIASITENSSAVLTVLATDPDAGAILTYSIVGGADAAKFAINATTGVLTFVAAPDFEAQTDAGGNNVYDVQVQVSDGLGGTATQNIAVTVTNQNEAPGITSAATVSVAENGTAVMTVTAADPDAGASLTYSIVGGADAAKFAINTTTGVLTFVSAPDFEAPTDVGGNNVYDVQVQVSDGLGGTVTQNIAVTVTNQNEAPGITSAATVSAVENGNAVLTVTGTDPDAGASLTYSITGGADAAKFAINPTTGVLTFVSAPDFEAPTDAGANNVYDVQVQVSDGLGGTATQNIAVTVTNQNEAPGITSAATVSVVENGTAVMTVTATDPDAGSSLSYSIVGGADAAKFAINPTTGVLTFVSAPDFESPTDAGGNNVYDVQVEVADGLGGTATQNIAVTVTNQNEAPGITSNGGGTNATINVLEGTTAITTVTSTDPDAGASLTYSIVSGIGDHAKFAINATTGALTFIAAPDFEAPTDAGGDNVYNVRVQVSDGLGGIDTQNIAVTVTNVNEAPGITSAATVSVAENGTAVMTVTAADPDAGASLTYSIVGGADSAKFAINPTTGVLTFIAAPDFEAPTDAGGNNVYDVQVAVADGLGGTTTQNIAVTVTNQNEAPTITSNGGGATASVTFAENGVITLPVTTVTATDPDAGASLTYSIVGGSDASDFDIDAVTGVLTFKVSPDFENPADSNLNNVYNVQVQVADGLGGTKLQSIAITVTDQNEAPAITSASTVSVAENGTAVLTVAATDPDAGASLTYSIIGGADSAKFAINATTGVLTFVSAPNFESPTDAGGNNVYDVRVQVSDGLGGTTAQDIAVTVTNQNEVPTITSAATVSVVENGTSALTVTATDPDASPTFGFSIAGGADASLFTINSTTGEVTFNSAPDFENPADAGGNNVYNIDILVSDGQGASVTQSVAITVTNQTNTINGTAGNDTLSGTAEDDQINGFDGDDSLNGSARADVMNGGADSDTVVYDLSGSGVTVNLATNSGTGGDAEGDTYVDIENVFGSTNDDSLTGNSGVNTIRGGNGNDTIRGNGGIDQLFGNAGNDTFILDLDVQSTSLTIDGGAHQDAVNLVGSGTLTLGQLSFMTNVETIDFEAAGVAADFTNFTATHATDVLGTSGPGNTLTFKMDGNDTFTVAAGEHFTQTGSEYTFFTDATLTTELAKVSIV